MKEYLIPDNDGYRIAVQDAGLPIAEDWIEIPAGANVYAKTPEEKQPHFRKISIDGLFLWTLNEWKKSWMGEDACTLWQRNKGEGVKEFLVNHDDKWTLQLLDSDTEENSYRVAVPSGAEILTECGNYKAFWRSGAVKFISVDKDWDFNYGLTVSDYLDSWDDAAKIIWQRSETEYLMQGENGDKLMESIAQLNNQETVKVTIDELKHRADDKVNNPSHYSDSTIECIDAMEAMLSPQEFIGYLRGNAFKYQWRYQKKNGIEDLQKSEWHLKKLIEKEMKNEDE